MTLAELLTTITGNLGITLEPLILLLLFFMGVIFMARSIRIGLIITLVLFSIAFVVFELVGFNSTIALIATMLILVILAISLYLNQRGTTVI